MAGTEDTMAKQRKKISIIIPTLNRSQDLKITLKSIAGQTFPPDEVVIIDQSNSKKTKEICGMFREKLNIIYMNQKEKSLTKARNKGLRKSKGEILVFLDDDVTLDRDYLRNMLDIYRDDKVIGASGLDTGRTRKTGIAKGAGQLMLWCAESIIRTIIKKTAKAEKQIDNFLLRTGRTPKSEIKAVSFTGYNMSFRASSIKKYNVAFDEKMKGYSYGEDFDFSHTLYRRKRKDEKLIISPELKLVHRESKKSRIPVEKLQEMILAHTVYIGAKHYRHGTLKNLLLITSKTALWFGLALKKGSGKMMRTSISAYIKTIKRMRELSELHLERIEKEICDKDERKKS